MISSAERSFRTCLALGVMGVAVAGIALPAIAMQDGTNQQDPNYDEGMQALEEARELYARGAFEAAIDAYRRALQLMPNNEEAAQGLTEAEAALGGGSPLEDVDRERRVALDRARTRLNSMLSQAGALISDGAYAQAETQLVTADTELAQNLDVLPDVEVQAYRQQITNVRSQLNAERAAADLRAADIVRREAEEARMRAERAERENRDRIINENLRRVRELQMEMNYREALQVVDQILFLDEHNPAALALRGTLEETLFYREYMETQRQKEHGMAGLQAENQTSLIPPRPNLTGAGMRSVTGVMQYPPDWPDITIRRGDDSGYRETPENAAVIRRVEETTIPVDFNNNTFEQVVNFLSSVTGLRIYVDWKALEFIGVSRDDEVTLQLDDVSVATALDRIMDQVGDDLERPKWAVQDGILTISSDDALRQKTLTVVYDIRDLLFEVPYFDNAPELDLDAALNAGGGQGGGGGGGGGFGGGGGGGGFGGGGGGGAGGGGGSIFGDPGEDPDRLTREELVEQIVNILQDTVDPNGWRDLGGETGSIQELNGNLIIQNTPQNHREINHLLSQLREIRALQINVEGRFLEVNSDWFEQIGVDLDLFFNTNDDLLDRARAQDPNFRLSDFFNPETGQLRDPLLFNGPDGPADPSRATQSGNVIGVPTDSDGDGINDTYTYQVLGPTFPVRNTQGFSPIGVQQDSLGLVETIADLSDFGSSVLSASPALSIGVQFLDDVQVDLLIEATQADRRSVVLTAPRLTFFNGQRAWVAVTTQTAFIAGLNAVTGDNAGAFQPDIGILPEGFVLDVEGVVSSDRRYVTMTVIASIAQNASFRETDAAEFGGAAGGGGDGDDDDDDDSAEFSGRVELPQVTGSFVQTTVSVPDKGTILLGGQRSVNEIEVETGVPVLSKIPYINRFFTNRLTSKEEQTLLILIRPEIIIQQENEDLLFPGLADTVGGAGAYIR